MCVCQRFCYNVYQGHGPIKRAARRTIECFHSRGQHICKFIGTKESVCIRKEFNSHRTGLGHQHGRRFIVLGHQYGHRDVMWKHSILVTLLTDTSPFVVRRFRWPTSWFLPFGSISRLCCGGPMERRIRFVVVKNFRFLCMKDAWILGAITLNEGFHQAWYYSPDFFDIFCHCNLLISPLWLLWKGNIFPPV